VHGQHELQGHLLHGQHEHWVKLLHGTVVQGRVNIASKIAGSGAGSGVGFESGSISQMYRSADPDPWIRIRSKISRIHIASSTKTDLYALRLLVSDDQPASVLQHSSFYLPRTAKNIR
jgi:hypothetical protein